MTAFWLLAAALVVVWIVTDFWHWAQTRDAQGRRLRTPGAERRPRTDRRGAAPARRAHTTTDPRCVFHRPPRNALTRWRYERNRGRACPGCC